MPQNLPASPAEIRAWAKANGVNVGIRGPINDEALTKYRRAHRDTTTDQAPVADE